jgi:ATP-dependent DNA helicase RecG
MKKRPFVVALPTANATDSNDEDREFATISERANRLLNREEGFDVDFKRAASGLDAEDLVSFANSERGGAILIGVDETKDGNGRQRAVVVGCPVGDGEKLKILSKANQCVPPVTVSLFVENSAEKPFYRIEIRSGPHRPYCTSGGTYKIRGDGRNETLYPPQLLALFLKTEGGEFLERFRQATSRLEAAVHESKQKITEELKDVRESVWSMESDIRQSLEEIGNSASNAEGNAQDANAFSEEAMTLIDQVHSMVEDLAVSDAFGGPELERLGLKLDAVLEKFGIEDPVVARDRRRIQGMARALVQRSRDKGLPDDRRWIVTTLQKMYSQIERKTIARWVRQGIEETDPKELAKMPLQQAGSYPTSVENAVDARMKEKSGKPRTRQSKRLKRQ